jgi:serine protease Do
MYGQVVGIISYKIASTEHEGMGFIVPMDIAKSVADSLIKSGYVEGRAKLGISYNEVDAVVAEVNNMEMGLYVASVEATSDLYGKVVKGDTIIEVNGKKVTNADVMLDAIESAKPNDRITLTVLDEKGKTRTVTAKLLADKGSSSYSTVADKENNNTDDKKENYTEEFDFPFGD